ncbi:hypothetical protein CP532_1343 [Ophiocordyceps camponoti-leonardi (nom. inval.)]|nr:hypothetical protein CP532_1343 [Ophiocordyceps camponoti-leonardi (nom. inval.)]
MPPKASTRKPSASSKKSAKAPAIEYNDRPNSRLRAQICAIFRDAQRTTATHRKLAINLRKVHEACCYEPKSGKKRSEDADEDEEAFNHEFVRCVLRIMPVKKAEGVGERAIRFVGSFLRYAGDKDLEALGEVDVEASLMPETPSTRLLSGLLEAVFPLMTAKDKFVRFRSTQLVSHIINSLDAIDDDLFQKLRHGLLKRIRDKEAMVRAQAVLGLGRIAGYQAEGCSDSEEGDEEEEEATDLLGKLLQVIQNDPSAEVRRSLLINLPILTTTLPRLLERARDLDPATRRAVYSRLLPALGDFRHLSLSMREKLLRWGLRDRDENVRKAAGRLFRDRWIADCAGTAEQDEQGEQQQEQEEAKEMGPSFEGLLELLERIDVVNSGVDNGIALEAMKDFWQGRPDYREAVTLDDAFWETLSAESVFMVRSFNDFCLYEDDGRHAGLLEEKMPEVTKLAFYLERYMQVLLETLQREDNQDDEDTVEQEFIVEQLLHIALTLDYSDEVGRRKMFTLLRQALSKSELPDEVTKLTVEALRYICAPDAAGEREFCSVVIESVADVHDTIVEADEDEDGGDGDEEDKEESFHSARSEVSGSEEKEKNKLKKEKKNKDNKRVRSDSQSSEDEAREKAVREIVVNLKCLHIVRCMLTHVSGNLKDKPDLVSTLNNLIVPAVRSHEAPVRERGLVCLGLCALLDRSLAEENLSLFIHFFTKGHAALQVTALHILTDMLNVHGAQLLSATPALLKVYVKAVKGAKVPEVQAVAALAASKLLLGRVVADEDACEELLKALVIAYFDPASASNQTVRQALNYFLPVFCYSRPANQQLMRLVALQALHSLLNLRQGLEDDDVDVDEDMVSMTTIGACLVDWTDPRKCYSSPPSLHQSDAADKKQPVNGDVHLDFAHDILERLRTNNNKEEKKLIASLLGKLHVSPGSSEETIRQLYAEVSEAVSDGLLSDATSRNALYKLHVSLGKVVNGLDDQQHSNRRTSRSTSVIPERHTAEDKTIIEEPRIKEEEDEDEEEERDVDQTTAQVTKDSILDSLLSDGEDVEMQDV